MGLSMEKSSILVVNAGSSSLKFALFRDRDHDGRELARLVSGKFERIGTEAATLQVTEPAHADKAPPSRASALPIRDHAAAVPHLLELLRHHDTQIAAVGHRVVHGGARFGAPQLLSDGVLDELDALCPLSPEHMPAALSIVRALRKSYRQVPHVACFDTAFHRELPEEAATLPIPRRYSNMGVRRYGFHGLSYSYLMEELLRVEGPAKAAGRVVLSHLGHGASMAAVKGGRCVDTTMALTPASGLVMGTRSGDLDPDLLPYLFRTSGMTIERFHHMVHAQSGLLGISETSGDVRDLLSREASDPRAALALAIFCYQAKKSIGSLAAALGGIDTLIFSGGIGENAAELRARICRGLEFLGIALDEAANQKSLQRISSLESRVAVNVLRTDEELYIARAVHKVRFGRSG